MKFLIALALIGVAAAASVDPVNVVDAPVYESIDAGMYIIPEEVIEELSKAGIELSDNTNTIVVLDDVEAPVDTADMLVQPVNVVDSADVPVEIVDLPLDSDNEGFEQLAPSELDSINWMEVPADSQDEAEKVMIVELPLDDQPQDFERIQDAEVPADISVDPVSSVRVVDLPIDDRLRDYPKQYADPTWR